MSDIKYNFKKIGERIRSERKAAGMNQTILAFHLQEEYGMFDRKKIGEWENGKGLPDMKVLLSLCNIFQCDIGYLLCEYDYRTRQDTDIGEATGLSQEAIESIENMPPDLKDALNFLIPNPEFYQTLGTMAAYKPACIRVRYDSNKDLLKSRSLEERREMYLRNESELDALYNRECNINQDFEDASKKWIRQKQKEVNDLSFDEVQKIINQKL